MHLLIMMAADRSLPMAIARTNIIKASSISSTSKVRTSQASRRILSKSLNRNTSSSILGFLLALRSLTRIRRASMFRILSILRSWTLTERTLSSGSDFCGNLYLVVCCIALVMSVDSRVSRWLGFNEVRISAHPIVDSVWVSCFTEFSALGSRRYIPDILQCHIFGVYSLVNSQ